MSTSIILNAALGTAIALGLANPAPLYAQETSVTATATQDRPATPLIPRQAIFGNPTKAQGQISPDGQWLSWMAPYEGTLNIHVAPRAAPDQATRLTSLTGRPPAGYIWAPDGNSVLYIRDQDGDENFQLYGIDLASKQERKLTDFAKTAVRIIGTSTTIKDKILVGLNNRDPQLHDVHVLDLNTGALSLVLQNAGYAGFMADDNLVLRMAIRPNENGGQDFFRVADNKVEAEPFESTTLDDALTTSPAGYTTDGDTLYWIDSRGRDTAALYAQDVTSGDKTLIAQSPRADIGGTLRDSRTGQVLAYSEYYLKNEWHALDPQVETAFGFLKARLPGEFGIQSSTDDDRIWIVANDPVTAPAKTYIYDRDAGTLTDFYTSRPELEGAPLQPMQAVEITSRDGLTLPTYLTLPAGSDANGDGVPDAPVPMVMFVHGGPWARDSYGYNAAHQWLANRGYAVMSVNFRGSTGFGKEFINAGNLQWGTRMQDDLADAMNWAVANGVTSADKVAIMGGSYGGYATLAGLAFTPDRYACGVDIVGPSNLETLLQTIPPYWVPIIRQFHDRMGNPNTPEGMAMLKERSPLYRASSIEKPLLIGQGANDPRVNKAESDQIVAAMKADGIPVTYVLFPDEGHGFARPTNSIAFFAVAENFLAPCLGGRAEPIGDVVEASTAQILDGAEHVAGLTASGG